MTGFVTVLTTTATEAEAEAIKIALDQTNWNRKQAARTLSISYRALLYKIQEYEMAPPTESAEERAARTVNKERARSGEAKEKSKSPKKGKKGSAELLILSLIEHRPRQLLNEQGHAVRLGDDLVQHRRR